MLYQVAFHDTWFLNYQEVILNFLFQACFMVACLKKEIEVQQQVNRIESELKELEELYREDEKDELLSHDLHSKISKIVEFTKTIKSYEKTCFEFPQQTHDEESDIADRFQKL